MPERALELDAGAAAKKLPLVAPQEYLLLSGVYAGVFFLDSIYMYIYSIHIFPLMFPSFSPHGALSLGFHFLGMLHGFCVGLWHAEPTVRGAGVLRSSGTSGPLGV